MPVLARFAVALMVALSGASWALAAEPRDEALRLAPPDAAFVVVVQNAREHFHAIAESPFAEWFPTSSLGKQLLGSGDVKSLLGGLNPLFKELGTTPEEVLNDILGDGIVFAYSPAPAARPTDERAVILVRPRKLETLQRLVDRVNEMQTKSKELTGVVQHSHANEPYFERRKAGGPSDYYCYRGSVFAFSTNEAEIKSLIERDKANNRERPELSARMKRLGVQRAAAVILIQPRTLDAELAAKIAGMPGSERAILEKLRDVWSATDDIALYFVIDRDLEAGLSVRFDAAKLPPWARGWLTGAKKPSALWSVIPDDALFAVGGHFKASELLDLILAVLPEDGKKALSGVVADSLGPVLGKDKLPLVLNALGPDWAIWAESPRGDGVLPVIVSAVRVEEGANGPAVKKSILQGVEFGFQTFRVLYNSGHADQIELQQTMDGTVTITTLVNDKAFPPGFRPSFALKGGYLLITSDPEAIRRFKPPTGLSTSNSDVLIARVSATSMRNYLQSHGPQLAKHFSGLGNSDEKEFAALLSQLPQLLEPLDRAELFIRDDDSSIRIAVRLKLVKPLKK